jgi:hypothetical protein
MKAEASTSVTSKEVCQARIRRGMEAVLRRDRFTNSLNIRLLGWYYCTVRSILAPLNRHIPEIGCSRAGNDGPKGGGTLRNASHPKLKKKKAKNAKRFSDIAKTNRQILHAARKAGKKLKSSSSNPMHIDNLISHEDETDKQPGDVDDNGLTGTFRDASDNIRRWIRNISTTV